MMEAAIEAPRKPAAVLLLQIFGGAWFVFGAIPLAIGAITHPKGVGRAWMLGFFLVLAGLCALAAGWRRPLGLVIGMISLSLMLVTLIGAIFVAIIGFLGARDRDQIRDYYAGGRP
jgi:hypothetical protein